MEGVERSEKSNTRSLDDVVDKTLKTAVVANIGGALADGLRDKFSDHNLDALASQASVGVDPVTGLEVAAGALEGVDGGTGNGGDLLDHVLHGASGLIS
jgi:hypothetical protein